MEEFEEYFKTELKFDDEDDQEKIDTVGGWVVYNTNYLPSKGELIRLDKYQVLIEEATPRHLIWLKITVIK